MNSNETVVRRFLAAVGEGDAGMAAELLASSAVWEVAAADPDSHPLPRPQSRQEFLAVVGGLRGQFPDGIAYTVHRVLTDGDEVAVEASCDGTTGVLRYRNRYAFLFRLRDGKVTHGREYLDFAYLKAFQAKLAESRYS